MATCWSVEHYEMLNPSTSTRAAMVLPLDDVQPSTASAATTPFLLDYSLMASVFAILIFLWMQ